MKELTQHQVRRLFDYRDGELYWKVRKPNNIKIGDRAGTVDKKGYIVISIKNKSYKAHRLIFLYHYDCLPNFLDHIDGDKSNNNISNLREATNQENHRNKKKQKSHNGKPTSSRFKGVCWHKRAEKWMSYINIKDKQKYLGLFTSEIDAARAYDKAAIKLFGEFAKLNECKPL